MFKLSFFGRRKTVFFGFVLIFLVLSFPFIGIASKNDHSADLIIIRLADTADNNKEMPDARFLHDKHTTALKNQDCSKCHLKENNAFVFKFNRTKDAGYDLDKELYHEKCVGCHQEQRDQGQTAGPLTSECRLCHTQAASSVSAAQHPFGMDKSLHYRHEVAETIPPSGSDIDANCSTCHHQFDKALDKTIYVKGEEGTCRYCHLSEKTEKVRSFKTVAHADCVNCHYQLNAESIKAGPTDCSGCHDAVKQTQIAKLENVPRYKRNQPDSVLLSLWLKDAWESKNPSKQFVNPVAFNHKTHEASVDKCYSCHHASMESCSSCHTRNGSEKSKYVRLGQAMHATYSQKSCYGCHSKNMASTDCSGCHFQMGEQNFSSSNCLKCHSIGQDALDPIPDNKKASAKIAEDRIKSWPDIIKSIPDDRIPDIVTIDVMVDQYEGAVFPHRKIVKALSDRLKENDLAQYFHDGTSSLCAGCHHYSLTPEYPPKCASCHGISYTPEADGRPGLKGAYHSQCITCHEQMGIEKPVSTDCTSCHKKRSISAHSID